MVSVLVALAGAIVTSLAGQTLLKGAADRQLFWSSSWIGAASLKYFYTLPRRCSSCALCVIPLSVALPCTAISYAGAALTGPLLFWTSSFRQCVAIGLISILIGTARVMPCPFAFHSLMDQEIFSVGPRSSFPIELAYKTREAFSHTTTDADRDFARQYRHSGFVLSIDRFSHYKASEI